MGKKITYIKFIIFLSFIFYITPVSATIIYKVGNGETLSSIAKRFGVPTKSLINANKGTKIKAGKKIVIPDGKKTLIARRYQKKQVIKQVINSKPKPVKQVTKKTTPQKANKQIKNKKYIKQQAKKKNNLKSKQKIVNKKSNHKKATKIVKVNKTRFVKSDNVNLRSGPSLESDTVSSLGTGTKVFLIKKENDWAYVKTLQGNYGWIYTPLVSKYKPYNLAKSTKTYGRRYKLVLAARKYLGIRYRWGAAGNGAFDCSGFVMTVFKQFGINLPHSAAGMFGYGKKVAKGDLQVGDVVFFATYTKGPSHVGIYIGNGKFIHASSGKHKGVTISSLSENYYSKRFLGAKRILPF